MTDGGEHNIRRREFLAKTAALAGAAGLASAWPVEALVHHSGRVQASTPFPTPSNMPIDTFVVLMQENRSFDHYFGWHPDADGRNAGLSYPDDQGNQHPTHSLAPDFQGCAFEDPNHEWDGARLEYSGGKLDGFFKASDEFAIGYYNKGDLPFIPAVADAFTLYDRYFCSLLGPTWPNRQYMHSATSGGVKQNASPADVIAAQPNGGLYHQQTIWDAMMAAGHSVTYYFSDLPFIGIFGPRFLPIIKPVSEFYADAASGNLPNLAFVDPMSSMAAGETASRATSIRTEISGSGSRSWRTSSTHSSRRRSSGAARCSSTRTSGAASSITCRLGSCRTTGRAPIWRRTSASPAFGSLASRSPLTPAADTSAT